jgi:parvulin-like peptidyl-prolyl isomerase
MNLRFILPAVLAVALLAGCGSSSSGAKPGANDVAVVGDLHLTQAELATMLAFAKLQFAQNGQPFPKAGTASYSQVQGQVVSALVDRGELELGAQNLGVKVNDAQVDKEIKKTIAGKPFNGDRKKFLAALKTAHYTLPTFRELAVRFALIEQGVAKKLGKRVKVTDFQVYTQYLANKANYTTTDSRAARYILLGKTKAAQGRAQSLAAQLKGAPVATWCTLAKKYSLDTSNSGKCGAASFTKGQTVPEFNTALFKAATNDVLVIKTSQYGWFVLQPTAPTTKGVKAPKQPTKKVAAQIRAQLQQTKTQAQETNWFKQIQKTYCKSSSIVYQAGFAPSPDPCVAIMGTSTTTTTAG